MASFKEYLNQLCFDCISRLFERKCGADLTSCRTVLLPVTASVCVVFFGGGGFIWWHELILSGLVRDSSVG